MSTHAHDEGEQGGTVWAEVAAWLAHNPAREFTAEPSMAGGYIVTLRRRKIGRQHAVRCASEYADTLEAAARLAISRARGEVDR